MAMKQNKRMSVLSEELQNHYKKNGVEGIEAYITKQQPAPKKGIKSNNSTQVGDGDGDCDGIATSTCAAVTAAISTSVEQDASQTHSQPQPQSPRLFRSRFIRLNPRFDKKESLEILNEELQRNSIIQPIPWLSRENKLDFYAIPEDFNLSRSRSFIEGRVYGMDVSSGAAVAALLLDEFDVVDNDAGQEVKVQVPANNDTCLNTINDGVSVSGSIRVLDLCCAPGLKTCAIADLLSTCTTTNTNTSNSGSGIGCEEGDIGNTNTNTSNRKSIQIIGVDVNSKRMNLCKNVIKKYHIDPQTSGRGDNQSHTGTNKHANANEENPQGGDHNAALSMRTTIQLYNADGTSFGSLQSRDRDASSLVFDSNVALDQQSFAGNRKRMNKSAKARERKRLKIIAQELFQKCNSETTKTIEGGHGDEKMSNTTSVQTIILPSSGASDEILSASSGDCDVDALSMSLFDRVLVDAECSTDGAVRHLQHKYHQLQCKSEIEIKAKDEVYDKGDVAPTMAVGTKHEDSTKRSNNECQAAEASSRRVDTASSREELTLNPKLTDASKLKELVALQKKLIESGFRLLKPGGVMVYSTCSLAKEQNEDVVSWLLNDRNPGLAQIVPVQFSVPMESPDCHTSIAKGSQNHATTDITSNIKEGFLSGTVRFHPSTSCDSYLFGGGFFLAKIRKLSLD